MQRIMNNKHKCLCASKTAKFCCPTDKKLRKVWLMDLEKEHDPVRQTSKEIVRKLKLLANSHRIEILLMLEKREHCMDEMARKLKTQKSAVSYHMGMLEKHGLICKIKRSRFAFYSLSQEGMKTVSLFRN
ncbi:MAG: winged helix-turn-helix transcriptional regulator [Candidatus Methanoperedens sp.]|nr:winged helix-turn-helix transcriptional regulator [Candidatus Methanoperedens sp.]